MSASVATPDPTSIEVERRLSNFREAIRIGRLTARISQSHLAAATGKSQAWMSNVENGSQMPQLDDAIAIAEILRPALGRNILEVLCDD